jgi:hypothetical protein
LERRQLESEFSKVLSGTPKVKIISPFGGGTSIKTGLTKDNRFLTDKQRQKIDDISSSINPDLIPSP